MPRIQLIISKACDFPYSLSRDFVGIIWFHPLVIASWFIDAFSFDNIKKNGFGEFVTFSLFELILTIACVTE